MRDVVLTLDHSFLAVHSPPGTGKTWNGARVIADLVQNHGWRVGVVAQSHSTVETMLSAVAAAGLDPARVGKKSRAGAQAEGTTWTRLTDSTLGEFTDGPGFDGGGTAWLFSNAGRIPRGSLDLLVIDEAGQYSLTATISASVSATRLLLLGDPQQLPQVSQGMHPTVCAPVSELSYEARLHAVPSDRVLAGIAPGLHPVPVVSHDNSTRSPEESECRAHDRTRGDR